MAEEGQISKKELQKKQKLEKQSQKQERQLLQVSDRCKGCGAQMSLDQRFCASCGAKRIYNRLNARNLFEDFVDRFLNIENHFFKTFIDLFKKPEAVIDGYINGVRKKYLSAFSYFAISLTITGLYTFVFRKWFLDDAMISQSNIFTPGVAVTSDSLEVTRQMLDWIFENQSFFSFMNIPLYAIVSRLVFWNYKKYNLIEHVVIYLYAYSHTQIITSVLGVIFFWSAGAQMILGFVLTFLYVLYTAYVLKRVFNLSMDKIVLKTLLFMIIFGVISVIFFTVVGFFVYKLGLMDGFIDQLKEMGKKQKELKEAQKLVKDSIRLDSIRQAKELVRDTLVPFVKDTLRPLGK